MSATIPFVRIALTTELKSVLDVLRLQYPLLKDAELIKMAVSKFYTREAAPIIQGKKMHRSLDEVSKEMETYHRGKFSKTAVTSQDIDSSFS